MVLFGSVVLHACLVTARPAKRQTIVNVKSLQRGEINNIYTNLRNNVTVPRNVSNLFATACDLTEAYYLFRAQKNESDGNITPANQALVDHLTAYTTGLCKQVKCMYVQQQQAKAVPRLVK